MKKLLLIAFIISVNATTYAQKTLKKSGVWNPWGVAELGLLAGSHEGNGDLRLQGGVSKNNWQLGAGIAKDDYHFSSVPMYLQARRSFSTKKRRPFVLASLGYNFATEPDYTPNWIGIGGGTSSTYQYSSGYYVEIGAGYAFRTHKKWGYNLSFSYTKKTMTEKYSGSVWNGAFTDNNTTENTFLMNRYALRIGIRFGN